MNTDKFLKDAASLRKKVQRLTQDADKIILAAVEKEDCHSGNLGVNKNKVVLSLFGDETLCAIVKGLNRVIVTTEDRNGYEYNYDLRSLPPYDRIEIAEFLCERFNNL